jgi:signal transduction histidine kinase/DNA-binding response OmpR family regulator
MRDEATEHAIRVLLVEDSPLQALAQRRALEREGFEVVTAVDGVQGIDAVYRFVPDAVVSDVMMPELNGYQLCRLIRNDEAIASVPVILLTSLDEPVDRFWGLAAGADLFLKKGEPATVLGSHIRRLAAERPCRRPASESQPENVDAKSRAAYLLDQLLFESTVTNRVFELLQHSGDRQRLASTLFELLGKLVEFDAVALRIDFERQSSIFLAGRHALSSGDRDDIVRTMRADPPRIASEQIVELTPDLGASAIRGPEEQPDGGFVCTRFPLVSEDRPLGSLTLFYASEHPVAVEATRVMRVVSGELQAVARYLIELDRIEALRRDVTAMLVHDLRSPLTSVLGFAELLEDSEINSEPATVREYGAIMHRSATRMLTLVNNILDASRIQSGEFEVFAEPSVLTDIVRPTVETLAPLAQEKEIAISVALPENVPRVLAEGTRIERVLMNLISNAVKFTPRRGRITVRAVAAEGEVEVAVEDTGVGIPGDELERVFRKYEHSALDGAKGARGTGLGLYICREIISAHGGRIWAESEVGYGSTFRFTLPVARESQ